MAYDIGPMDEGSGGRGARRLLALAAYLETVSDDDYDHRHWRKRRDDGGWAMCALGHAATALPDLVGLRWRNAESCDLVRLDGSGFLENTVTLAAEAFELTVDEAVMIFGLGLFTTRMYGPAGAFGLGPREAAAAIRALAVEKMAPSLPFMGRDSEAQPRRVGESEVSTMVGR